MTNWLYIREFYRAITTREYAKDLGLIKYYKWRLEWYRKREVLKL